MSQLHSRLYEGWVRHRRYTPKSHAFNYPVFMTWLALDELDQVMAISHCWSLERFNLVSFYWYVVLFHNATIIQAVLYIAAL